MVIRLSKQKTITFLTAFLFFAIGNLSRMLQLFGIPRELSYGAYLLVLAAYFVMRLNTVSILDILYYLFVLPFVAYGLIKYGAYTRSDTDIFATVLVFLPAYLFFRTMQGQEELLGKGVLAAAWFSAFYLLVYYVLFVRRAVGYNMSYAYWVSFPICLLSDRFYRTKNPFCLVMVAAMYVSLVLSGCRGALLLTTLYMLWIFFGESFLQKRNKKKYLMIAFAVPIILLAASNMDLLISFLARYSGQSRNIRKLLEGNYLDSSSRDVIYMVCRSLIDQHPWGYGPLASRALLVGHNYPHSLYYELQLDMGRYLGFAVFCAVTYMTIANLFFYRSSRLRATASYLCIVCVGALMVSSSYYYEMNIPAMAALFVNHFREKRRKKETEQTDTASA